MKLDHTDQVVTPAQAKIWLQQNYPYQRKINPVHVSFYAQAMRDEQFAPTSVLMFSRRNGDLHLLNGQTTLSAIVECGRAQHLPIVYYEVKDEAEEADLYSKIDRQRKRTLADSIRCNRMVELLNLSPDYIQRVAAALRFVRNNFDTQSKMLLRDDELLEWTTSWAWEFKALQVAIHPCPRKPADLIQRQTVLSVALVTLRYQLAKARDFWKQVAQDDGLAVGDPRKTLLRWLSDLTTRKRNNRELTQPGEVARGCASAWNAYYDGRSLRQIRVDNPTARMYLKGTAYNGHQDPDFLPLYLSPHLEAEHTGKPVEL